MSIIYKFKSLNELAAYLEGKAVDIRAQYDAKEPDRKTVPARERNERTRELARAGELESIAYLLRNTLIESD